MPPFNRQAATTALQELARRLGRSPRMRDAAGQLPFAAITYAIHFGSWDAALTAAGLMFGYTPFTGRAYKPAGIPCGACGGAILEKGDGDGARCMNCGRTADEPVRRDEPAPEPDIYCDGTRAENVRKTGRFIYSGTCTTCGRDLGNVQRSGGNGGTTRKHKRPECTGVRPKDLRRSGRGVPA